MSANGSAEYGPNVFEIHAHAKEYASLLELVQASSHVVIARVEHYVGTEMVGDVAPLPFSTFELSTVASWVGQAPPTFRVRQLGGFEGGQTFVVSDDPLMAAGEEFLLFLSEIPKSGAPTSADPPLFKIHGGPQGRFIVEDGAIYSLDRVAPEAWWLPVKIAGKTTNAFEEEVKGLAP